VDGSVGIIVAAHTSLCSNHIYKAGTRSSARRYLPKLASGEWIGCWSLTEPEAGSDAAGTRSHAVLDGDAGCSTAPRPSPPTRTMPMSASPWRSPIAPPRSTASRPSSSKGHARFSRRQEGKQARTARQRHRRSDFRKLPLGAVATARPQERRLRRQPRILDGGRISIAALSIGMAQGAYDAALSYSKMRKQFGRPISEFQAIQHKLVDMAVEIDAARLLNYRAAWMLDRGQRVTRESSMAKLFASEAAVRIAGEAVQIHGGYGFIKDYPGGEVLSRREALHHRRRHQRNPAPGDRPPASENR
jgi:alkylation response protein AidB-like acyl-CoA dehydrogenase